MRVIPLGLSSVNWYRSVHICTVMDSTSKPGENDESDDDDEIGEFEKYVWVPG